MKKYLMIGFAAIAFASCSNHDIETMSQEQIIKAQYEANFVAQFGQPASNQTWGFGTTRAFTRGVFSNGNEWAANDRDDCKYRVPPALTPDQIAVVKKYFQTVKNPDYQDPHWTDYFIQQVYKGGSDPINTKEGYTGNASDGKPYSAETYAAADGQTQIVGSNNMDHLAAIDNTQNPEKVDHNENFNGGDCGAKDNVLNFKGTLTTVEETYSVNDNDPEHRHKDKINLMTNSTTKSFGYYNSNSSVRRTEYTGLVNFQTIIDELGAEANCLNDGWNRSFMGFDFEMMIGDGLYQDDASSDDGKRYVKISDIPGNAPQYIWDGQNVIKWYESVEYDANNNYKPVYTFAEGYDEYIRINGQRIPYLSTNTSMYAGSRLDAQTVLTNITQSNQKVYKDYNADIKNVECLNLPLFQAAFEAGYCPTKDSNTDWVKVGGTADGYYSDWIVTLTEATKYETTTEPDPDPITYQGRIMAEDLTASVDVTGTKSDWDFNDVVFDWAIIDGKAYIRLLAAGGTLPLTIGGALNSEGEVEGGVEIHSAAGLGGYMMNTGVNVSSPKYKEFVLNDGINYTAAIQIKLYVKKGGQWIEIEAEQGEPAGKFNCPVNTPWCDEYVNITDVYENFTNWVANPDVNPWTGANSLLTDGDLTNNAE